MCKINCEICLDLLPLVADGVASNDSKKAVMDHIKTCKECNQLYKDINIPEMDEEKIIKNIKRKIFWFSIMLILLGGGFGIAVSASELMFYNIIIMPAIGVISYLILKTKALYVGAGVFLLTFVRGLVENSYLENIISLTDGLVGSLMFALLYLGLFLLGILIGFLLKYGFGRK